MRARPWLACALLTLVPQGEAKAVGIGSTEGPLRIREEFVLVIVDEAREHVVYAARAEPAVSGAVVAVPTPSRADVEPMPGLDLPAALHTLVAGYEERALGRKPAAPAPWASSKVDVTGRALDLSEAGAPGGLPLDASWLRSLGARSWLALVEMRGASERGVELVTPAVRIGFTTDRPGLVLREPPLAEKAAEEGQATPAANREPYAVEATVTSPAPDSPSSETLARVLRTRAQAVRACYDTYLADHPGAPATVRVDVVINRHGETETAVPVASGETPALAKCVAGAVRAKQFPRIDRGWRFTAAIHFVPPAAPSRSTHVALLGKTRLRWTSPPAAVTVVRELEVAREDVERALDAASRRALGLDGASRLWLTEYLDTTERRHDAADLVVASSALPAEGEPGTLAVSRQPAPAKAEPLPVRTNARPRASGIRGRSIVYAGLILAVVGAALALAFSQDR